MIKKKKKTKTPRQTIENHKKSVEQKKMETKVDPKTF